MNKKPDSKISDFIKEILFADKGKAETVISLRKLILKIAPSTKEEIKWNKK